MEEGLIRPSDEGDNLNLEIDRLFHDLTGKEEYSASRIRLLEAELEKKKREMEALAASLDARENQFRDREGKLKELAGKEEYSADRIRLLEGELEKKKREMDALAASLDARENQFRDREGKLKEIADKDNEAVVAFYDRMLKDFGDKEKRLLLDIKDLKEELIAGNSGNEKLRNDTEELRSRLNRALEQCAEEQNRGKEKDIFSQSARSALKDKETEIARIWHILEETKAELVREKARLSAKDAAIDNLNRVKQNLELDVSRISGAMAQGEQGFYEKFELLKRELKEKERLGCELEQQAEVLASKAQSGGAEQKLARLLEARDEVNKNLARKIKSMEEALAAVHAEYAEQLKAADDKGCLQLDLKRKEEETAAARERQRALEKELAETAEKWRFADAQLNNAAANLRKRDNEIEMLSGRVASLEHERENYRKISAQAQSAAGEFAALAEKSENEQITRLFTALKAESAKYGELLKKHEDLNLRCGQLGAEKAQAVAEAERLARENRSLSSGAERKAGGLLEARNELIKELTQRARGLEDALAAERGRTANLFQAAEDEKKGMLLELKRREEEAAAAREGRGSLEKELADTAEKWRLAAAQLNNAVMNLRKRDNAIEILNGRLASLVHECENYRKSSAQAQNAAAEFSALVGRSESEQVSKLFAALKSEAARHGGLLKEHEALGARAERLNEEKKKALAEAERLAGENRALKEEREAGEADRKEARELREKLKAAEEAFKAELARTGEAEKTRYEALSLEMRRVGAQLRQKELELEATRNELDPLKAEYEALLESRRRLHEKYSEELRAESSAFEEVTNNIRKGDELLSRLAAAVAETRREAEKIRSEKEALSASLKNRKAGQDRGLRKALAEAEKRLRDRERRLERMTGGMDRARREKDALIEKERGLRANLDSRPYSSTLKEAEEKLALKEKILRELQDKMDRVTADFAALKRQDSQLSARSTDLSGDLAELLAGISHQVSNSISVIRSHAEFCLETPDSSTAKESLGVIVRNIVLLQKKIEDMLGFSKPVRLQLTETALRAAAAEALENIEKEKDLSGIRVDFREEAGLKPLMADRVRLVAALEQVFLNAVEAMPGGGALRVAVRTVPGDGTQLLEVSDTGEGIEPKNISMVFHPFFTTRPGKLGLGLALVKNIIKAHGGTISVSSGPEKGATVAIAMPEDVK